MKPLDEKNKKITTELGYNMTPIELVEWDKERGLMTARAHIETLSDIADVLSTIASTWGLQDETAIGHPYERVSNLSAQLNDLLRKATY